MFSRFLLLLLLVQFYGVVAMAKDSENQGTASKEIQAGVVNYYSGWKKKYLKPSVKIPGDYKIAFKRSGTTVSEAMGYGMLITVMMDDADPQARVIFDGLDRFRKRYPSKINPAFMCWKIPPSEKSVSDDAATDGDMDMAMALLMAYRQWGDKTYLHEAMVLINALTDTIVRFDETLRLGDWDTNSAATEMIRTSDLMPTHFRAFEKITGDGRWLKVEERSYAILRELQRDHALETGLVPDFAIYKRKSWEPAKPGALEGPHDGEYSYNACRVPWRIGWAAIDLKDRRAVAILKPFMTWVKRRVEEPEDFKAGYHLNGKMLRGADFDSPCFISPTGVAAMGMGDNAWRDAILAYALKAHEGYYEDSVNLLCLLVMTGKAELP